MEKALDPSEKGDLAKKALQAIRNGNGEELLKLLLAGADPNAAPTSGIKNGASNTLLYHAVAKQDASLVNILLDQGANANGSKADGPPPLEAAVVRNNAALIKLLLLRGADVNHRYTIVTGNHKGTKTVLFEAATSNTYELLLKNGANLHAKNSWHETPLHFQAYNWSSRLVHVLKNTTPLDNAIFRKPSQRKSDDEEFLEVCRILLRNKAVVSWSDPDLYFQSKGKPDVEPNTIKARLQLVHEWNSLRNEGSTSFKLPIEVFRRGALDIATYYTALNRGGRGRDSIKPKKTKVIGGGQYERSQREGEIIKGGDSFLIAAPMTRQGGSPLTSACKPSAWDIADSSSDPSSDSELRRASGSDNTSAGQEVQSKIAGDGCVNPERSQRVFSNRPEAENPLYRCKVCVVGPSRWGKTSFIKSFTSGTPTLESMDIRTIGIDLFPWSFDVETEAGDCEYQVSFWDFAGQEEYRAAHTLFYSSRTLYLLCINLDRYHNALTAASDSMDQTVDDRMMDAFADINVFRWVRMICAHHPQAEFVFLGTKADLLQHDRHKIIAVQQDIVARFNSNVRRMKDRVQRALQELEDARFEIQDNDAGAETPELDDQIAGCEQILRKQPGLLSEELIVFSSADLKDESIARGKLKALLMMSGSSVLLPPSYAELLKHAQQRYMSGQKHLPSFQDKVDTAFVSVSEFIESVTCASKLIIPEKEMLSALHLLHDTGDIVWFDGVSDARLLQERLFLDPMLVIEFIRQIVNHKVDAKASVNGYVSHSQLQSLPFWKDVSSSTIQQLKELLLHLNLAYSAGKSKKMVWNSDLIIPVYWNRSPGPTSSTDVKTFSTEEEKSAGLVECVRWEYSFEPAIPENLYEKLAVATYSPLLRSERKYGGSSFIDKVVNEYSARVAKEEDTSNFSAQEAVDAIISVLSVSVAAQDRTLAWKQLVWYCMNLESLLKTYPGLLVTRCTVNQRAPDFGGKDVLGIITDECKRQIDRSMEFHEVLHRAGISDDRAVRSQQMETNRDLSPYEVLTLLNCLLRLHNQDFQPDDISQLSGLVCGVVVQTNEYIWASRNEILQHGKDIVLAVDYSKRPTKDNASTEEKAALGTLPTVEILPPILTETLSQLVPAPTERDSSIISSAKADSPEDSVASKGMLQAMRRRLSSSKAAVPTAELEVLLKSNGNAVELPSSYAGLLKDVQQRCDIVWFDGVPDLEERLFLNPVLLIAFIRQIVNPEMDAKASVDGCVTNILIQNLPCWRSANTATLKHLKKLLLLLNLAYSGSEEME
ncbi:hypothetical protein PRNP1_007434 [Phytophthora ramorum]